MKSSSKTELQNLRELRRAFQHISLKIATGSTLDAALRIHQRPLCTNRSVAKQWNSLREAVLEGRVPPKAAIEAFVDLLDTRHLCLSEMKRRGLGAQIQARVIALMSLGLIVVLSFMLDAPLVSLTNALALGLCGAGYGLLHYFGLRTRKSLWRLEWFMLWFYVATLVRCGMTPAQALSSALEWCGLGEMIPLSLRKKTKDLQIQLRRGEIQNDFLSTDKAPHGADAMDYEILIHVAKAVADGIPASTILFSYLSQYKAWLNDELQMAAEKTAYLNLFPLYLCFAPSIFLVLFGRLLLAFSGN